MTTVTDDVDGFDDVGMFESGADTKLCSDLLLILLLCLTGSFGPKLFDGENVTIVFSLDQADGTAGARPKDATPFAVLLGKVGLCGFGE